MNSIPRQLATFAAVLVGLYAVGVTAGQFIDLKPHGTEMEGHNQKGRQGAEHSGPAPQALSVRYIGL